MKKVKNVIFRSLLLVFAIVLVFATPLLGFLVGDDLSLIYSTFIGKKSEYQGVIEVWNIDSFDSGIAEKSTYIEQVAKVFQKKNKGAFVIIRNLTQNECLNLLEQGEKPDIFSCSYGVADKLRENISAFESNDFKINDKLLNAGKIGDELYGVAWTLGYYVLISTKTKLEKAGLNVEEVELNKVAYQAGYEYKSGKKTKISRSLCYGTSLYLMPKNALLAYNKARSIQIQENEENALVLKTGYSAYSSFLVNEATILLGTQRDVCRMAAREEKGKISDVLYLPLTNWTDLVQFAFVTKKGDELQNLYAEKFVKELVSSENQTAIEKIGMFPVVTVNETTYKGIMRDIILENFGVLELKSVF